MKNLMTTIGIGLMVAFITPTFAQDTKGENKKEQHKKLTPEERAKKKTDKMTTELGLSADQAKQVYDINLKHAKAMVPINAEMQKIKEKAKAERQKTKAEMDKVLTTEQKAKAKELRSKGKGQKKGKGGKTTPVKE